jgi:hypothetical protein
MVHFKQKKCWKSTLVPIYEGGTSALLPKPAAKYPESRRQLLQDQEHTGSAC